jgi:hypothetical protein
MDGHRTTVLLHKNYKGCTYLKTPVTYKLAQELGLFATDVNFARLYVNNAYYRWVMDLQKLEGDQVEDRFKRIQPQCSHQEEEEVGILRNAHGGKLGSATFKPLGAKCDMTAIQRLNEVLYQFDLFHFSQNSTGV